MLSAGRVGGDPPKISFLAFGRKIGSGKVVQASQDMNDPCGRFYLGLRWVLNHRMHFALAKHSAGSAKRSAQKLACSFLKQAEEAVADIPPPQPYKAT